MRASSGLALGRAALFSISPRLPYLHCLKIRAAKKSEKSQFTEMGSVRIARGARIARSGSGLGLLEVGFAKKMTSGE